MAPACSNKWMVYYLCLGSSKFCTLFMQSWSTRSIGVQLTELQLRQPTTWVKTLQDFTVYVAIKAGCASEKGGILIKDPLSPRKQHALVWPAVILWLCTSPLELSQGVYELLRAKIAIHYHSTVLATAVEILSNHWLTSHYCASMCVHCKKSRDKFGCFSCSLVSSRCLAWSSPDFVTSLIIYTVTQVWMSDLFPSKHKLCNSRYMNIVA